MEKKNILFFILVLIISPFSALALSFEIVGVVPGCGDGIVESGEDCDMADFAGKTCTTLGYASGPLSCTLSCIIDTSSCVAIVPPPSGGGGGVIAVSQKTNVAFVGKASPFGDITLLKDGVIIARTTADMNADFQITLPNISGGNYVFGIYSDDINRVRSSTLNFNASIAQGVTTKVGGIFISPTLLTDKTEVKMGENIVFSGQTTPNAFVSLLSHPENIAISKQTADKNGIFIFTVNTLTSEIGKHQVKVFSEIQKERSATSSVVDFIIGSKNILVPKLPIKKKHPKGDVNYDSKVNLTDFSIELYWFKRKGTPPVSVDFNGDGKVTLVDFSIMAYYWTG